MRFMPSFDAVLRRLFGQTDWVPKVLLGGALCFVPIVHFLAFGYLLEYAFRLRSSQDLNLPEWQEFGWRELFIRGLYFTAVFVGTFLLPLLVGFMLGRFLDIATFGMLGYLAYVPLGFMGVVAPSLFLSSLLLYTRDGMFSDAWNLAEMLRLALAMFRHLVIPTLAFWGFLVLALPLYGFACFIGIWVLVAYSIALLHGKASERQSSY